MSSVLLEKGGEAGEMPQRLRAQAVLLDDPGLIPSTHTGSQPPAQGNQVPSSGLCGTQTYMQTKPHTHKIAKI